MPDNLWSLDGEDFADTAQCIRDLVLEHIPYVDDRFLESLAHDLPVVGRMDNGVRGYATFQLARALTMTPFVMDTGEVGWWDFKLRTRTANAVWTVQAQDYTSPTPYWEYEGAVFAPKTEDMILSTTTTLAAMQQEDFWAWVLEGWTLGRNDRFPVEVKGFERE
jgi:hypothetical protein